MDDEPLQREEDERYQRIDRVIDKADAGAADSPGNGDDGEPNPPEREDSAE